MYFCRRALHIPKTFNGLTLLLWIQKEKKKGT